MNFKKHTSSIILAFFIYLNSFGTEYYCNPSTGNMLNNGTLSEPWSTLEAVFKAGKVFLPGDIIYLMTGHHGYPTITGNNPDYVTVRPWTNEKPTLRAINLSFAKKWKLYGLTVSPETAPLFSKQTLISVSSNSSYNIIDSCFIYSVMNITAWTESDWLDKACNGISVSGIKNIIRKNRMQNVNFALQVSGDSCLAEDNIIENFMSDGIRGLGDYCTYQYNQVKNCFKINDNHDDGFQSWSVGPDGVGTGTVYGVILRGNIFISYTDPGQPYKATFQGIGCFDGMFEDWIVENNVVITDMWHGLSLYGAVNCKIVNNTVVKNPINAFTMTPWIGIYNHKNGTASTENIIRNNIASSYNNMYGSTVDHNATTTDYAAYFTDYSSFDLHLKQGSPAIDAGSPEDAPGLDLEKNPRPSGNGFDLGAYEFMNGTISGFSEQEDFMVNEIKRLEIYPVPFFSTTRINFLLTETSQVNLSLYSISGSLVKQIISGKYLPGIYSLDWNSSELQAGIYFCCFESDYHRTNVKIIKLNE